MPPEAHLGNVVHIGADSYTWTELADWLSGPAGAIDPADSRVAFLTEDDRTPFAAVAWLVRNSADGLIMAEDRASAAVREVLAAERFTVFEGGEVVRPAEPADVIRNRLAIFTSGTTGAPKLHEHSWDSINTMRHISDMEPRRWLLPYAPGTYAWYQMVGMSLLKPHQSLVVADPRDTAEFFSTAEFHGADAISSTPTFWRFALTRLGTDTLGRVPLRQISLGGEIVDQSILDELRSTYPDARITHIYASTEVGAIITVADGMAGFPAEWLESERHSRVQLKLTDGTLRVRSLFAAASVDEDADGWIDTGDRVEIRESRAHFVGRVEGSMINVGGSKAYPADIESVLLAHPAVRWASVSAQKAPLIGFLPAATVVMTDLGADAEAELTQWCTERLVDYAVPRFWTFLDEIPMAASLKSTGGSSV